ncbi:DUF4136 domain-containing protein [Tenacibaculum sp. SG-28]|uniref:DUF4136 domain-containing protein n=1 Tax=Tenacibaculum sp. SG-28 TaxID=754426 RepID=UPI000CF52BBB|nr:DUF4136 domain-containing protein [Tenacibaculum sp. SG-28]PQJ22969.1 hypothetical protein BSU00_01450 [Tenacibaculum sp. SG-28]
MKRLNSLFVLFFLGLFFLSCSSVRVSTDYDTQVDFGALKTFAFYKTGVDKAAISDLDKKRIMRAIEAELLAKGMTKSATPDVLVNIFTKSRERVDVNDNSFGGYWYPWYYGPSQVTVSTQTEGTLFIDLLDTNGKNLLWQGIGTGVLQMRSMEKKEERIKEFVHEIMEQYPPQTK